MMKLDELIESWKQDSIIDETQPQQELIRTPILHAKYVEILSQHRIASQKAKFDYIKRSTAYATTIAENYVGLPLNFGE